MKIFSKVSIAVLAIVFVFSLTGPTAVFAATSPDLGVADSFSILAGTPNITDAGGASDITGDVGLSPATGAGIGLLSAQVDGTIYAVDAAGPAGSIVAPGTLTQAKSDLEDAYDDLSAGDNADVNCLDGVGGSNVILPSGTDLAILGSTPGTLPSGVYCSAGTFLLTNARAGSDLTLTGDGPWVFRTVSGLTTSPGSSVTVDTGSVCDVWWRVGSSATLDTTTSFIGNILALTSITMNTGATLDGRALARNGAVTLDHNNIDNSTCSTGGTLYATLHVVKDVENDDGDDQHADDFTLYVKSSGTNVAGSPALGVASPGRTYLLDPGTYVVSEDEDSAYNQSFSGGCNSSGSVTLAAGQTKTCTITNDDKKDSEDEGSGGSDEHEEATPKLPDTGMAPDRNLSAGRQENTPWNSIILSGILMLVSVSLVIVKRKRAI